MAFNETTEIEVIIMLMRVIPVWKHLLCGKNFVYIISSNFINWRRYCHDAILQIKKMRPDEIQLSKSHNLQAMELGFKSFFC